MEPAGNNRIVYVHVGLPKCGSTALQHALATRRDALGAAGILYPVSLARFVGRDGLTRTDRSHMELARELKLSSTGEAPQPAPALADLVRRFEASGARRMILSSESFSARAGKYDRAAVGDLLAPYDVRIVMFVRRPDRFTLSLYKQAVKMVRFRYSDPFSRFLVEPPPKFRRLLRFDVSRQLERLRDVFGASRVHLVGLDGPRANSIALMGDIVGFDIEGATLDPAAAADAATDDAMDDAMDDAEERLPKTFTNVSLGDAAAVFLAMVNRRQLAVDDFKAVIRALKTASLEGVADEVALLTPDVSRRILERHARELDRLRAAFPEAIGDYAPPSAPAGRSHRDWLTAEEFEEIRSRLLAAASPRMREVLERATAEVPAAA